MNTVDELWDEMERIHSSDPTMLTPDDIDKLILYHRRNREGGLRPTKDEGPAKKIDLAALGVMTQAQGKVYRR